MKQVWKWVMHLNAKAFCLIAVFFFVATTGWCMYMYMTPPEKIKEGSGKLPSPPEPWLIGILDYVDHQLADDSLVIPIEPFRPTMDGITTAEQLAAFEQALKDSLAGPGGGANKAAGKQDPFKGVRPPGGGGAAGGSGGGQQVAAVPMVTPKIAFLGFFKRSDGEMAAMFSDSTDNSTVFYEKGKAVHGVEVLRADMKEATVRYPDGSEGKIPIGGAVELEPEPAKPRTPPPAAQNPPAMG